ncbi:RluA family pseudouridine synthase [Proteinivorax tanatarense]|uniref:Pseudouridine synthase n=1 Tax=Proteinivorax tanatarense TaxID=1260629 RepID=A0AAU7VPN0_9FIRM
MQKEKHFTCQQCGIRVDVFLVEKTGLSRSQIKKLIQDGNLIVDGKKVMKSSLKLKEEQKITLLIPEPKQTSIEPENIPLNIIYEDTDICVVNKPQDMVVHPAPGHYSGTLVNGLLYHLGDLSSIGGVKRPGVVHRLDKDTSGLLVVAKNDNAHEDLSNQMAERLTKKIYWAIVEGVVKREEGVISAPVGRNPKDRKQMVVIRNSTSREATTYYKVVKRFKEHTLLEFDLITGRTHQIRVHSKFIGHPIVGDLTYGFKRQKFNTSGQILHAKKLGFYHPVTKKWMNFTSPIPAQFTNVLKKLIVMN